MEIIRINPDYQYGFHIRCRASITKTVEAAALMGINAMQLYLGNSRGYALAKANPKDILSARSILEETGMYICAHAPLVYNLAGKADPSDMTKLEAIRAKVIEGMTSQLDIMAALGGGVVVHPNSCKDKKLGIKNVADTVTQSLTRDGKQTQEFADALGIGKEAFKKRRLVILENADGAGSKLAVTLSEIANILELVHEDIYPQVRICIDTAHIYGAGQYDFGKKEEIDRFYTDFDEIIGIEKLEVFHLNDSRRSKEKKRNAYFGSRKDQHEYLGKGYIFDENEKSRTKALKYFFMMIRKKKVPVIGEPPKNIEFEGKLVDGPGGKREWGYVSSILRYSKHPLEY